jgi:hypothetical protein
VTLPIKKKVAIVNAVADRLPWSLLLDVGTNERRKVHSFLGSMMVTRRILVVEEDWQSFDGME